MADAALLVLRAGPDAVTVDPARGAMLTSLVLGGVERLRQRGPGEDEAEAPFPRWGCFIMAPWVGRLARGVLPWRGKRHQLPLNWRGHAIHGLVAGLCWDVEAASENQARMVCRLPRPWPFGGTVRHLVSLEAGSLTLVLCLEAADQDMPAAVGWHPWFRRPEGIDLAVTVVADRILQLDPELLPTGRTLPVDERTDLRNGPAVGGRHLDTAYVGVQPPLRVAWPDLELVMSVDTPAPCVVVYTGDPSAVCVEPMSGWPNAAGLQAAGVTTTGLVDLPPGGVLEMTSRWRWAPRSAGKTVGGLF